MAVTPHWYRLCVDVSPTGAVQGASWERRSADEITKMVVLAPTELGPFDDALDAFAHLCRQLRSAEGLQLTLFPS